MIFERRANPHAFRLDRSHEFIDSLREPKIESAGDRRIPSAKAAENVLLSVAAGFRDVRHRVAYRTALDQLDLLAHPSRSIQIALAKPTRSETLSGRRLTVVQEPETALNVGAKRQDGVLAPTTRGSER